MTPEEVQDEILRISTLSAIEAEQDLQALRAQSQMPMGILRGELKEVKKRQREDAAAAAGEDIIRELNDDFFVMSAQSKVRIGQLKDRSVNGHVIRELSLMTQPDFGILMRNKRVGETTADQVWLESEARKEYRGFFTNPDLPEENDGKLNLWQGFSVTPKKGSIKIFRDHLLALVGGNEDHLEYLMDWIAYGFQNPHVPIGVVVVFIGDQGTGKGILGNCLRSIYGGHGVRIGTANELTGKHNNHLLSACYAFLDEALFAGNKQVADQLKGLTTEPTIRVEPKFQDSFEVDNMLNMLASSNHDHAMAIEFSDRRFVVFGVPISMKDKTRAYWKKLGAWTSSEEGKAAILWHMLRRDLSGFDAEAQRPHTPFYTGQKMASLSSDWLWWRLISESETFQVGKGMVTVPDMEPQTGGSMIMGKAELYNVYRQWASGERGVPVSRDTFYKNARRWLLDDFSFLRKGGRGAQTRMVQLPTFVDMHQDLTEYLGGED